MVNPKKHTLVALGYLLVIALLGVFLRLFFVVSIPVDYRYIVHSHSHVALLGWVYTGLTTLIYWQYLVKAEQAKKYRRIFISTQITIIGMLVVFPFTGYALFSIIFSTLFLLVSYWFLWFFLKYTTSEQKRTNGYKCIRLALWYMVLSSIGPWALGIIVTTLGSGSDLYRNAIYFYLHFQYNGWFIVALFGILIHVLEENKIMLSKTLFNRFYWTLNSGVMLTYFLSILWMEPHMLFYVLAGIGAVLQVISFGILFAKIHRLWGVLSTHFSGIVQFILKSAVFFYCIKLVAQFMGAIPYFATSVAQNKDFVIGYIHWVFLGVISVCVFGFLSYYKLMKISKREFIVYLVGFSLTEVLIFYKGIVLWLGFPLLENYFMLLFITSVFFLLAITAIFRRQFLTE
ncbi:MAG: hypothetical protein V3U92_05360 [Cellulophaga sp.]